MDVRWIITVLTEYLNPNNSVNMTKKSAQICGIYDGFWARIS